MKLKELIAQLQGLLYRLLNRCPRCWPSESGARRGEVTWEAACGYLWEKCPRCGGSGKFDG